MIYHQVKIKREFNERTVMIFAKALIEVYRLEAPVTLKISSPNKDHEVILDKEL